MILYSKKQKLYYFLPQRKEQWIYYLLIKNKHIGFEHQHYIKVKEILSNGNYLINILVPNGYPEADTWNGTVEYILEHSRIKQPNNIQFDSVSVT